MGIIEDHLAARESDTPLVLDVPSDPDGPHTGRLVAEVFRLADDGRIVMVDVGWAVPANPGHPFHILAPPDDGPHVFEGPDGAYAIRPLIPGIEPRLADQWARWREARGELDATRERARGVVAELIGPTTGE